MTSSRARLQGKLTNAAGEFVASGICEVDVDSGQVTMWPSWEVHMLERQRGPLALELDDGRRLDISDRHLTFKIAGPAEQRISVYRLRVAERVPEHLAAGYAEPSAAEAPEAPASAEEAAPLPLEGA
ncbi:MAG: hypothetical protein WEC75_10725 [Dehalococcoidia bacterium]